jgi:hypothetical protein
VTDAGLSPRKIGRVAVLGGGLMGSGIATALVLSGVQVVLKEVNQQFLDVSCSTADACMYCVPACMHVCVCLHALYMHIGCLGSSLCCVCVCGGGKVLPKEVDQQLLDAKARDCCRQHCCCCCTSGLLQLLGLVSKAAVPGLV